MAASKIVQFDAKNHVEITKKEWFLKQEAYRKEYYRKSKYPPMIVETHPHERQRIPFKMTAEDRALRAQWLADQHLSPNEPRHVPELRPRNFFRRLFGMPWDLATKLVTPTIGLDKARYFRYFGPKIGMYFAAICITVSYFKNNKADWQAVQGWNMYSNKLPIYPGQPLPENPSRDYHEKHCGDFNDRGFSQRKVLRS